MTDNGVRQPLPDHGQTDTLAEKGEKRGLDNGADHLENHDDASRYLKGNPFGDEKEGETDTVKYVTMSWWYVMTCNSFIRQTELTRPLGTVVSVRFQSLPIERLP